MVWDDIQADYITGIASGHSATEEVFSGNSPIYFYFASDAIKFRTEEDVEVDSFDDVTFILDVDTDLNLVLSGATPGGQTVTYPLIQVEGSKSTENMQ